jgi:hypothetical protein
MVNNAAEVIKIYDSIEQICQEIKDIKYNYINLYFNSDVELYSFIGDFEFKGIGFIVWKQTGDIREFIDGNKSIVSAIENATYDLRMDCDDVYKSKCTCDAPGNNVHGNLHGNILPEDMQDAPVGNGQPEPQPEPAPAGFQELRGMIFQAQEPIRDRGYIYANAQQQLEPMRFEAGQGWDVVPEPQVNLDPDGHAADLELRAAEREDRAARRLV